MNFNKVILVGRLTADPQKRFTTSGFPLATFTLAVNRERDSDSADFIRITAFGGLADVASNYLSKGRLVLVEGAIRTRNWEDESGQRHYVTEVVAEKIRILEKRQEQFFDNPASSWSGPQQSGSFNDSWEETPNHVDDDEPPF